MLKVTVYDTKPYDRRSLEGVGTTDIEWSFMDFRLRAESAVTAAGADAVCVFVNDHIDRPCLEELSRHGIKLVALRCTGFNNVDVEAAQELGIKVSRVPVYSPYAVAEHAISLLMTLNRKIHRAYVRVREMNFALNGLIGRDLNGKTAGVLGTGKIGRVTAQILRGLGMRVVAFDPYPQKEWAIEHRVEYVELNQLYAESDVVSLHVPLLPETHHIINAEAVAAMKEGVIIVNVSRGALIDTSAIIEGLKSGKLGGVALDVYEEEEGIFFEDLSGEVLHDDELARLLTFHNVLITSHQAFLTYEALADITRTTISNLHALATGGPFVERSVLTDSNLSAPS